MEKYKLRTSLLAAKNSKDELVLINDVGKDGFYITGLDEDLKLVLSLLDGSLTINQIFDTVQKSGSNITKNEIYEFIDILLESNLAYKVEEYEHILRSEDLDRFSRQISLFESLGISPIEAEKIQKKLQNSNVVILGLGGTGSYALHSLAAIGVGKITAVDFDKVELSNISRQMLYSEKDIGKLKTEVALEKIIKVNSSVEYNFINKKLETIEDIKEIIRGVDFVITQIDTPRFYIKKLIDQACFEENIPYLVNAGTSSMTGVIGPIVIPGKTSCYHCMTAEEDFFVEEEYLKNINYRCITPVIEPLNSVVANIGVLEVIKHLTDFEKCNLYNKMIIFDFNSMRIEYKKIEKKKNCKLCGEK